MRDDRRNIIFFTSVWFSRNPLEILCTEFPMHSITAADHSSSGIANLLFFHFFSPGGKP
jgi:hypothetical protein